MNKTKSCGSLDHDNYRIPSCCTLKHPHAAPDWCGGTLAARFKHQSAKRIVDVAHQITGKVIDWISDATLAIRRTYEMRTSDSAS
ncbi:hypothetical protein [Bradyrhizobium sp. STM 3561]|uniref:hypothetical protein n=1 Tax=unclassified Bradyrhizobium TaxID=2631580 RepID=UPI003890F112